MQIIKSVATCLCLTSMLLAGSCLQPVDKVATGQFAIKDSLRIETGFAISPKRSGTFFNAENGVEWIYFYDPVSTMMIRFFDLRGNLQLEVQLDSVAKNIGEVDGLSILTLDSIVVLGAHNNTIAWIDRQGKCFQVLDETTNLTNENGDTYNLYASLAGNFIMDSLLLFNVEWGGNPLLPAPDHGTDRLGSMSYWFEHNHAGPFFASLSFDLTRSQKPHLGATGFFKRFCAAPARTIEGPQFAILNDHLLLSSCYVDSLFIVDPVSLSIIRSVQMRSAHSATHIPPPPIDAAEVNAKSGIVSQRLQTGGSIGALAFDDPSQQYLAIIYHQIPFDSPKEKCNMNRSFSILAIDTSFTRTAEYVFPALMYDGCFRLSTSQGVYFQRHEDHMTRAGGVHIFDRIEFQ